MKRIVFACCGLFATAMSFQVSAVETVIVNGNTFQCQNACVVSTSGNGSLFVSDTMGGWVQMLRRGRVPVPQVAASPTE